MDLTAGWLRTGCHRWGHSFRLIASINLKRYDSIVAHRSLRNSIIVSYLYLPSGISSDLNAPYLQYILHFDVMSSIYLGFYNFFPGSYVAIFQAPLRPVAPLLPHRSWGWTCRRLLGKARPQIHRRYLDQEAGGNRDI